MIPQEVYKKILNGVPIACVDMVIKKEGKVLLVKRANEPAKGQWWLPGGRILKNEQLADAVRRKAGEEVGLEVEIVKKIGAYETFFKEGPFENLDKGVHTISVCFLVKPLNDSVKLDKTSLEYRWTDEFDTLHEYVREVIRDSIK